MNASVPKPTSASSVPVLRVTVGSMPEDRRDLRFQKLIRIWTCGRLRRLHQESIHQPVSRGSAVLSGAVVDSRP